MKSENGFLKNDVILAAERKAADSSLHPAWRAFVRYCVQLQHGEIEKLKIQDGLPIIAEVTREKIKFTR